MTITIIVAASTNNAIGNNNALLWHLPNDLKFFKNTTWAMPIVMGRKTFESMGNKPLPGRINIIITRNINYTAEGILLVHSLQAAIEIAKKNNYNEIFIAGGGEIYKEALLVADKILLTKVEAIIEGDTFFEIPKNDWILAESQQNLANEKHLYNYDFETWIRK
jgi:dihydrofolate reductase